MPITVNLTRDELVAVAASLQAMNERFGSPFIAGLFERFAELERDSRNGN